MRNILLSIVLLPFYCFSQPSKAINSTIDKWKRASVGLEMRKFASDYIELQPQLKNIQEDLQIAKQSIGTAVFLKHNSKRYLISARHVLHDIDGANQLKKYSNQDSVDIENAIFQNIFRIAQEDEINEKDSIEAVRSGLPLLGVMSYSQRRYVFSSVELDLAIISLDGGCIYSMFADFLESKGYVPITLNDIDTSDLQYGQDIISIGFPLIGFEAVKKESDIGRQAFQSGLIWERAITFGKISIPKSKHYFCVGDISTAPGNSGGPLISKNKLVAIVSKQAVFPIENNQGNQIKDLNSRMPYAIAVRAAYIYPLLMEMIKKDEENKGPSWCR